MRSFHCPEGQEEGVEFDDPMVTDGFIDGRDIEVDTDRLPSIIESFTQVTFFSIRMI